jgi:multicomponent Na+:H+ antiporter subunit D
MIATLLSGLLEAMPAWLVLHAPALIPTVPLIAAPISALIYNGRVSWLVVIAVSAFAFLCALILLAQVQGGQAVNYFLGGWAPPLGIAFRVDALNAMLLLIVTGFGVLAAVASWPSIRKDLLPEKHALFYSAYLLCLAGLAGIAITADAFNLFVFLEVSSIATYVLVAMGARRDRRALRAAFDYLIMGSIGATFFVIGIGFLYAATGTLNMADIARLLPETQSPRAVQAGLAFIVVGLGLKFAMWPMHQWLPNAYAYSPSFVTVFLAATATKVALYAMIRFLTFVFPGVASSEAILFAALFAPLAIAAMVVCSFQAMFQTDVRRMLAFSSVAQVGYMVLGLSLGTQDGLAASLLFLFNHALIKGALFLALAGAALHLGGTQLRHLAGLARQAPLTSVALGIGGLSLIGVPLTAGFQSKFVLMQALFAQGWWWAALIVVASSLLAVVYVGRMLEAVFFQPHPDANPVRREAPLVILVPLLLLSVLQIAIGFDASLPIGLSLDAAEAALNADPLSALPDVLGVVP